MEEILKNSIPLIVKTQHVFSDYKTEMFAISHAGDPRNAFSLYFPLIFCLCPKQGRRLLIGAVVAEWFNIIFKWILFGDRPYWWIKENNYTTTMQQFKLTCETGPGSPSGHVMVTGVVYYIMLTFLNEKLPRIFKSWLPFSLFILTLLSVSLSRIFIAAHFPHQVVGGVIAAAIIAKMLDGTMTSEYSFKYYTVSSVILFTSAIFFNTILKTLNVDMNWSVGLAKQWCANSEWVSLNSTPYNSIVRDASALFGFGIATEVLNKSLHIKYPSGILAKLFSTIISLAIAAALESLTLPKSEFLFYVCSSIKYITLPIAVVHVIPVAVNFLFSVRKGKLQ